MNRSAAQSLSVLVCLAMLVPAIPASASSGTSAPPPQPAAGLSAAAAENPDGLPDDLLSANGIDVQAATTAASGQTTETSLSAQAWESQGPALAPGVHDVLPGRAGGTAVMRISLPRRSSPGVAVKNVRVRIERPTGVKAMRAAGKGWRCTRSAKVTTCGSSRRYGSRQIPPGIKVVVAIKRSFSGKRRPVRAEVSWSEQKILVGTGGNTGPVGSVRAVGWKRQRLHEVTWATVDPPLTVSLRPVNHSGRKVAKNTVTVVTGSGARARQFILTAAIRNVLGRPTAVRWTQLSGPKVYFRSPRFQQGVDKAASQVVTVPATVRKPTKLRFRIKASSEGSATTARTTVNVRPKRVGTFRSDPDDLARLAKRQKQTPTKGQKGLHVRLSHVHVAEISDDGAKWVSPGELTTLEFQSEQAIRSIQWSVLSGDVDPSGLQASGRTVTFTAPRTHGATALIQAVATMKDGDLIVRAKLVAVSPNSSVRLVQAATPTDPNTAAFCQVVTDAADGGVTVVLRDGSVLSVPAAKLDDGVTCDKDGASLAIVNATLAYAGSNFTNVKGAITATGISLDAAKYVLPDSLQKWAAVAYAKGPVSLDVAPVDEAVSAGLANGAWQDLTGQFAVLPFATGVSKKTDDALALLPLPGGWKFPANSSRLTFRAQRPDNVPDTSPELVGKLYFQQAAQGPDGTSGSVIFDVLLDNGAVSKVVVTTANIGIFGNTNGDQISASGKGEIQVNPDGSIDAEGLSFNASCSNAAGCQLVDNLMFQKGSLDWTPKAIALEFAGSVVTGQGSYGLTGTGTYVSSAEWSVELKSSTDWVLGDSGVSLSDLDGKLAWVPEDDSDSTSLSAAVDDDAAPVASASRIDFTVAGAASIDQDPSNTVTIKRVSASVTNECTDAAVTAKTCSRGEVRVDLAADTSVRLPGSASASDLTLTATVNLVTLAYTFSGNLTGMSFGPSAFAIDGVALTLSNSGQGACMPTGQKQPPSGMVVGINASGTILSQRVRMSGMVRSEGYCLWGGLDAVTISGATVSGPTFAYATFPATVNAAATAAGAFTVGMNSVSLVGTFQMPGSVEKLLPTGGQGKFQATMTTDATSFTGDVSYVWDQPVWLMSGGTSNTNLGLKSAGMKVTVDTRQGSIGMTMSATADLYVPAKPDKGLTESYTPMFVSIGITVGSQGANLDFAIGADPATGKVGTDTIQNAFGQPGMQVKALTLSGSIGTQNRLDFYADVVFPTAWQQKIAITKPDTDVQFGLSINVTNPAQSCLLFELGTPSTWQEVYASYDDSQTVVDIANKGIVRARYFKLAIAPTGCTLPSGKDSTYTVPAGFAFAFDGQVLGARVLVQVDVQLPSPANGENLKITGALAVDSLSVAGAKLTGSQSAGQPGCDNSDGPRLFVDIDTAAKAYLFKMSARIEVGKVPIAGAFIDVCGTIDAQGSNVNADLYGHGEMKLIGLGTKADLTLHMAMAGGKLTYANVAMDYTSDIFIMSFHGSANLLYQDGKLQVFRASIGAGINFLIGKIEGTVAVGYCRGKWTDDVREPTCDMTRTTPAGANVRVDLWGSLRFLFWKKSFAKAIYDNQSASPTEQAVYLGRQKRADNVSLAALQQTYDSTGKYMYDSEYDVDRPWQSYYLLKVDKPDGPTPCQVSGATIDWRQTATSPNAMQVLTPNPSRCTLGAFIAFGKPNTDGSFTWAAPQRRIVECTARGCTLPDDPQNSTFQDDLSKPKFGALPAQDYYGLDYNRMHAAMTKVMGAFGQPGTPVGALPTGSAIGQGMPVDHLLSANGQYRLEVGATDGDVIIRNTSNNSIAWHTGANMHDPGTAAPALVMDVDGALKVMCSDCEAVYWSSDTAGIAGPSAQTYLTDIGTLQIEKSSGTDTYDPVWSTELTLQNTTTGYCMDAKDFDKNGWPKEGTRVIQFSCNGSRSQSYLAEPVDAPGSWTWASTGWVHKPAFRLHTGWQQQLCPTVDSDASGQPLSLRNCGQPGYWQNQAFRITTQTAGDPLVTTLEYVRPNGGGDVRWVAPDGSSRGNFLRTDQSKGGREYWARTN